MFTLILKIILVILGVLCSLAGMAGLCAALATLKDWTSRILVIMMFLGWFIMGLAIAGL